MLRQRPSYAVGSQPVFPAAPTTTTALLSIATTRERTSFFWSSNGYNGANTCPFCRLQRCMEARRRGAFTNGGPGPLKQRGNTNLSTGLGNWATMPELPTVRYWRQKEALQRNICYLYFIFISCFWHAGIKTQHLIPAVFSLLVMLNQTLAPRNRRCLLSAITAREESEATMTGSPCPHSSAHTHNVSGYATRTTAELRVIGTRSRSSGTVVSIVSHPPIQDLVKRSLPRKNLVLIRHLLPPGSALERGASPLYVEAQPQSFAAAALQPSTLSTLAWGGQTMRK